MNFGILLVQGPGEQLRPCDYGGLCRGGEDRLLRLHAGAGLRQRVLHLCGPKLRRRGKRTASAGGIRQAALLTFGFCAVVSTVVIAFARPLLMIFVQPQETEILDAGVGYLWVVALFYWGIGLLFLLYGLYRAVKRPGMSVVLTVISWAPGWPWPTCWPGRWGSRASGRHPHRLGAGRHRRRGLLSEKPKRLLPS